MQKNDNVKYECDNLVNLVNYKLQYRDNEIDNTIQRMMKDITGYLMDCGMNHRNGLTAVEDILCEKNALLTDSIEKSRQDISRHRPRPRG